MAWQILSQNSGFPTEPVQNSCPMETVRESVVTAIILNL